MIRILSFTSLYPNTIQPQHGVFVEERLRHLAASGEATVTVIAPVPWFPSRNPCFGRYAEFAHIPLEEIRHGIRVLHPRYPVLPKIGMNVAPALMTWAMLPTLKHFMKSGEDFDLIDAHYFYPDGVAAVRLGKHLGKPTVVTARGTDVSWIPRYWAPRAQIRRAAFRAQGLISVSHALGEHLVQLGVPKERITVLRNGVDLAVFRPQAEAGLKMRRELGSQGPVLLSVGHLIDLKGHHIVIESLQRLQGAILLIAGEGPMSQSLRRQVTRAGLNSRVHFLGPVPHRDLPRFYNAADLLVLASSREGMPNVVLEALACGTPVVSCDVGGVSEVLAEPFVGQLVPGRNAESIARGIEKVLTMNVSRDQIRTYAHRFSWQATTDGQLELFRSISRNPEEFR